MDRRRYLSIAAAGITVSVPGCQLVLSRPQYVKATALSRILPTAGQLEKYSLVSETESGPNENNLKALFREFTPVEAAEEPVASRLTAGAGVARNVETAKTGLADPVKDALAGKDNDVAWVSIEGYRVAKWVDRRQRAVFTLQDANLVIAIVGAFDGHLTAERWAHIRQYMTATLRRLVAAE